jgi:hypothetical protein
LIQKDDLNINTENNGNQNVSGYKCEFMDKIDNIESKIDIEGFILQARKEEKTISESKHTIHDIAFEDVNRDAFLNEVDNDKSYYEISVVQFENNTEEKKNGSKEKRHLTVMCKYCNNFSSNEMPKILQHCRICPNEAISSKIRKLVCIVCSYSSTQTGNMKKHLRIHLGAKCYSCHFCSYSTTHGNALEIHLRNHTGEKPFKCLFCAFSSSSLAGLSYHKNKKHISSSKR